MIYKRYISLTTPIKYYCINIIIYHNRINQFVIDDMHNNALRCQ